MVLLTLLGANFASNYMSPEKYLPCTPSDLSTKAALASYTLVLEWLDVQQRISKLFIEVCG